jgi:hypothetical protein
MASWAESKPRARLQCRLKQWGEAQNGPDGLHWLHGGSNRARSPHSQRAHVATTAPPAPANWRPMHDGNSPTSSHGARHTRLTRCADGSHIRAQGRRWGWVGLGKSHQWRLSWRRGRLQGRRSHATGKRVEGGEAQLKTLENGRNGTGWSFSPEMASRQQRRPDMRQRRHLSQTLS